MAAPAKPTRRQQRLDPTSYILAYCGRNHYGYYGLLWACTFSFILHSLIVRATLYEYYLVSQIYIALRSDITGFAADGQAEAQFRLAPTPK